MLSEFRRAPNFRYDFYKHFFLIELACLKFMFAFKITNSNHHYVAFTGVCMEYFFFRENRERRLASQHGSTTRHNAKTAARAQCVNLIIYECCYGLKISYA